MATVYAFIYGKPPKQFFAWLEERKVKKQQQAIEQKQVKQQGHAQVEVRAPVTLNGNPEVSFANAKLPSA